AHFRCIIERISDGGRNTEHSCLTDSFGAKWPVLVRNLDDFTGEFAGEIEHAGYLIIGEAGIHDLPVIEDHFLENSEAELHRPSPDKLALHNIRIDRRAGVTDINELRDANTSGFRIDLDFGACTSKHPKRCDLTRLAGIMIRLLVRGYERTHADNVPRLHCKPRDHNVAKCHSRARRRNDRTVPALKVTDIVDIGFERGY